MLGIEKNKSVDEHVGIFYFDRPIERGGGEFEHIFVVIFLAFDQRFEIVGEHRQIGNFIGEFVFGCGGKMVVADLGTGEYTKATFGPKRYDNWVQSGIGHNPPVFDGVAQAPGREFRSGGFTVEGTPGNFTVTCDLTPAYPAELGLKSCVRTLRFDGEKLTVTDSFTAEKPLEMTVRLFHECPGVEVAGAGFTTACAELPLADSWLRAAWGEKIYETRLAAPRATAGEITYTIRGGK